MTTDKQLLKTRFAANLHSYNSLAVVQDEICGQLAEMLQRNDVGNPARALEIGSGTGFLTRRLMQLYPDAQWFVNDLVPQSGQYLKEYTAGRSVEFMWGDAEALELPHRLGLLATASVVQWFDDLPAFLSRCGEIIEPDGVLAFTTFGPDNFHEIKATTGESLAYPTSEQLQATLDEADFYTVETLEYTKQLLFATPADVLRHIKATGVNSIRPMRWTKQHLSDFETQYQREFATADGHVTLTYHPILILAQKR